MKVTFTIEVEAADDTAFCPASEEDFLARELCVFATRLWTCYAASDHPPDISVRWEREPKTRVTIE